MAASLNSGMEQIYEELGAGALSQSKEDEEEEQIIREVKSSDLLREDESLEALILRCCEEVEM